MSHSLQWLDIWSVYQTQARCDTNIILKATLTFSYLSTPNQHWQISTNNDNQSSYNEVFQFHVTSIYFSKHLRYIQMHPSLVFLCLTYNEFIELDRDYSSAFDANNSFMDLQIWRRKLKRFS